MEEHYQIEKPELKSRCICSVYGCSNRASKNISLYRPPTGDNSVVMRKKWINVLKMKEVPTHLFVCVNHFSSTDFITPKKGTGKFRRLRKNAIPSQNLPRSVSYKSPSAKKKKEMANRKERAVRRRLILEKNQSDTTEVHCEEADENFMTELNNCENEIADLPAAINTSVKQRVEERNQEESESFRPEMFPQQHDVAMQCSSQSSQEQSFSVLNSNTVSKTTQTDIGNSTCTQTDISISTCTQADIGISTCTQTDIGISTYTQTDINVVACCTQTEANVTTSSSQTEHKFTPAFYEAQLYLKELEMERLRQAIESKNREPFSAFKEADDATCLHYTGLKLEAFKKLREIIICAKWTYKGSNVSMLSVDDQLFLTLMKLRHNFTLIDLSHRFKCSIATVSKVFRAIISVLHKVVFETFMNKLPSAAKNNLSLPKCFETFRNCRVILDCTEISCQVPKSMEIQRLTFSSYKHRNTFKILIGISPNGTVVFCSKPFPGSMSDRDIVLKSGLLELLQSGDLILADKGFRISDILPQGVALNIPPFLMNKQFTEAEIHETKRIASARVHVERIMQRLKLYKILNCIPSSLFSSITKIVQVCALLVNFQSPILNEMKDSFVKLTSSNIFT